MLAPAAILLLMILSSKASRAVQEALGSVPLNEKFMNLGVDDKVAYFERDTDLGMTNNRTELFRESILRFGLDSSCAPDRPLAASHKPKTCENYTPIANKTTEKTLCSCADCSQQRNTTDYYSRLPSGEKLLWFQRDLTPDCSNMSCNFLRLKVSPSL